MSMIEKGINLIQHPTQKVVLISILLISGISVMAIAAWQSKEIVIKLNDFEVTLRK
jgi:hypothetical protein